MTTIERLKSILPGQTLEWYSRIANEIDSGRMPMPSLEPPSDTVYSYSKADLNPVHRVDVTTKSTKVTTKSTKVTTKSPKVTTKSTKSPKVSDRLVSLCNGDRKLAVRLVVLCMENNPGKSNQWAIDKAVWDLERDRGAL